MKIQVQTRLDDVIYTFFIDEKDEKESLHRAAVLGNPPQYCHECKNDKYFKLQSNKDKEGNIYVNLRCQQCGATAKLGEYKAGGYFWHKFEQYKKKNGSQSSQQSSGQENQNKESPEADDISWE